MRFTISKKDPNIGKVWNDDKTVCYGVYGQVGALLDSGILVEIDTGRENWIFVEARPDIDPDVNQIANGVCVPQASREALKGWLKLHLVEGGGEE